MLSSTFTKLIQGCRGQVTGASIISKRWQSTKLAAQPATSSTTDQTESDAMTDVDAKIAAAESRIHQFHRFAPLNAILGAGGHRGGELSLISGAPGSGKTSFAAEYALDLCAHSGVSTAWCSFGANHLNLEVLMATQLARNDFFNPKPSGPAQMQLSRAAFTGFARLPLYFMQLPISIKASSKQRPIQAFLEQAERARASDARIEHIIVDNVDRLLPRPPEVPRHVTEEEARQLLATMRTFAQRAHLHLTLISSAIKPATVSPAEVDNVLAIREQPVVRFQCRKYVDVTTNVTAKDAEAEDTKVVGAPVQGILPLYYNPRTLCFSKEP